MTGLSRLYPFASLPRWTWKQVRMAAAAPDLSDPPVAVAVTNSDPVSSFPPSPDTAAGAALCGPAAFSSDNPELDAIISALEAEWLRDGIVMKATALRVAASSLIHPSASFDISQSISVGA